MGKLSENKETLAHHLAQFQQGGVLNRIAGKDEKGSGGTFQSISPVDKSVICDVARGTATDIDAAATCSVSCFCGLAGYAGTQRRKILINIAEAIEARAEEIAHECWDTGQALRFMSKAAIRGAENSRYFADQVVQARDGQHLKSPTLMNITARVPIGPVGVITPEYPFMLSTWKIALALAAGCTVVHKPAEALPLTARLLVEMPRSRPAAGRIKPVNGFGEEAGKALCA